MASDRRTGTVTRKMSDRGFGFVEEQGRKASLFLHAHDLRGLSWDDLREGDRVTYDVEVTEKGERARAVKLQ